MIPPGIPDFLTRIRLLDAGKVTLTGRAWAGRASITRVEVSTTGGAVWADAQLKPMTSRFAWQGWSYEWNAMLGNHKLLVRATDSNGNRQPVEPEWNIQGMGNNMAQIVEVIVE